MTPDKNFRMNRETKTFIAFFKGSKHKCGEIKKILISGQLHEEAARREALKSKDKDFSGGAEKGETKGRTRHARSSVDSE